MNKKILVIIFLILILTGTVPKILRFIETNNHKVPEFTAYYETPKFDVKIPDIELSGELKPYYFAQIYPRIDGTLKERFVNIGDSVKKGQTLAIVDAPIVDADKKTSEADLITSKNNLSRALYKLNFAKESYERYKKSSTGGAISIQELQQKETDFKTAMEDYKMAQANLERAQSLLKRADELKAYEYIKAPFDGVITKYNADTGANVVSGGSTTSNAMFEIAQINRLRLRIDVPQAYLDRIKTGENIKFYVPEAPQKFYFGRITSISKMIDSISRTMKVEIIVENKDNSLYPGLYVKSIIPFDSHKHMLLIKNSLLITDAAGSRVLTVNDDGILHFKTVTIGKDFGDVIEITSGLSGNEKIVTNMNDKLSEGQKVNIKAVK